MTNEQPEPLRLADELLDGMSDEHWNQLNADAAAELRRLHAELDKVKQITLNDEALLRQALEALAYWLEHGETPGAHDMIQRTHDVLQERLK